MISLVVKDSPGKPNLRSTDSLLHKVFVPFRQLDTDMHSKVDDLVFV